MEMRRRGSLISAIAWHTVLCIVLMLVASYVGLMVGGIGTRGGITTMTTPLMRTSSAYQSVSLEQKSSGPYPEPQARAPSHGWHDPLARDSDDRTEQQHGRAP